MGKKSAEKANVALDAQTKIAGQTADIGEKLLKETEPGRVAAQNTYMGLSKGNVPGIEKYTAPSINAATQQFYLARKAVEGMPPGAMRDAAMRDINMQEASTKTGIYSGSVSDANARLASMGMWGAQTGTAAYGQAGQAYGQVGQSYTEMASEKGAMAGQGVQAVAILV